jgi:hypothetical protein
VGATRYGVAYDVFEVFQSFVSQLFHTVVTSGSSCPSTTTYHWMGIRFRNSGLSRNAQNAASTSFYAGGTLTYNSGATHPIIGASYFDLAGPTSNAATYYMDPNGSGCSSGSFKTINNGGGLTPTPFDDYGTMYFGTNVFSYIGSGGNPLLMLGFANQTVNAATFSGINSHVFSGTYTAYDATNTQTRKNIFMVPDTLGTTFTLRTSNSDSDPTNYTALGTLACTSVGTPSAGFCSGTLTLSGVTGTGKAACAISTLGAPILSCVAQKPDSTDVAISMIASVPARSVLSVSLSPNPGQVANTSTTIVLNATLTNVSGRAITSMANPGGGLDLVAPFTNTGAYAGTGGTCTSTLAGFASCIVPITYAPSAVGTHMQTFRVAYNNGVTTTNATAGAVGTCGLSSVAVDQTLAGYSPNTTNAFTATATYSNGSTQDVSSAVTWSSNTSSKATFSGATASFFQAGNATLTATLGTSSDAFTAQIFDRSTYFSALGQADTDNVAQAALGALQDPEGVAATGTKIFVADTGNNRIAIFNTVPTSNAPPVSLSLCQSSTSLVRANNGGISGSRCWAPTSVSTDGTHLAVQDGQNNRLLLWSTIPTVQGQVATVVLGQPDMSATSGGGTSRTDFNHAGHVFVGGGKVLVTDNWSSRVLIYNSFPTVNYQQADFVVGQANFTASLTGNSATRMNGPTAAFTDGTRLYVSDTGNNRVLIWTAFPTVNGQAAQAALGQTTITAKNCNHNTSSPAASYLCSPAQISGDGTKLYVVDGSNNRVLIWNTYPTGFGVAANVVVGAPDMTSNAVSSAADGLQFPTSAAVVGTTLVVADAGNHRVQVFSPIPTSNGRTATYSMGQLTTSDSYPASGRVGGVSSARAGYASGISSNGKHFALADYANSRVMLWSNFPTANVAPDIVVGQADFTSSASVATQTGVGYVNDVMLTKSKLLLADSNARVLIWNTIPTSSGAPASIVLGQPNFTSSDGSVASRTLLMSANGVYSDGKRVAVADCISSRVLIWNTFPTVSGQQADLVLGQPDFTTTGGNTSATRMDCPVRATFTATRFFVIEAGNRRMMVWNSFPTVNGQAADLAIGAVDLNSTGGSIGDHQLQAPKSVFTDGTRLLIGADNGLLMYNAFPTANYQNFDSVIGQVDFDGHFDNVGTSGSYTNPTGLMAIRPGGIWSDGSTVFYADDNNRVVRSGSATTGTAVVSISDGPTYNFGSSASVTISYSKSFTVSNTGSVDVKNVAAGTAAFSAPFYYKGGSFPGTGGTCGGTLTSGSNCTVIVNFLPTASGVFSDSLKVSYVGPNGVLTDTAGIGLAGTVTTSNLTISDGPTYAFGTVATTATKTFTVTNSGGTKTTLMWSGTPALGTGFSFNGGGYPGVGGTCTTVLEGGATCTIVIKFAPSTAGSYSDTARVTYTDADSVVRTLSVGVGGSH